MNKKAIVLEDHDDDVVGIPFRHMGNSVSFQKTKPLQHPNNPSFELRSKRQIQQERENRDYGVLVENSFQNACNEIIRRKFLPWLVSCKHASKNEDLRHQTDFKLRAKHPDGYEFFIRVQIKSSHNHLHKFIKRPLEKGIVLIIISERTTVGDVIRQLENVYIEMIKYPQEIV